MPPPSPRSRRTRPRLEAVLGLAGAAVQAGDRQPVPDHVGLPVGGPGVDAATPPDLVLDEEGDDGGQAQSRRLGVREAGDGLVRDEWRAVRCLGLTQHAGGVADAGNPDHFRTGILEHFGWSADHGTPSLNPVRADSLVGPPIYRVGQNHVLTQPRHHPLAQHIASDG